MDKDNDMREECGGVQEREDGIRSGLLPEQVGHSGTPAELTNVSGQLAADAAEVAAHSDARLRYAGELAAPGGKPALVVVRPPASPPRFRRTKRLFRNIGLFILLVAIGGLVLALFGDEGLEGAKQLVDTWWWPATAARVGVYVLLSLFLLPRGLRRMRENALYRLQLRRETLLTRQIVDYERLQAIAAAEERVRNSVLRPWWGLVGLLMLDMILFQLPYVLH